MQSIDRKFLIEAHNDIVSTGKLFFTHELFICYFIRELKVIRYAFLKRIIGIIFILLCFHPVAKSQSAISIDGYINDMQSLYYIDEIGWLWENQLHNRINLYMYPSNWLRISLQVRNRFQQNNLYGQFPDYQNSLGTDPGLLDLTWSLHDNYNDKAGYIFTTGLTEPGLNLVQETLLRPWAGKGLTGDKRWYGIQMIFLILIPISMWIIQNGPAAMPYGCNTTQG